MLASKVGRTGKRLEQCFNNVVRLVAVQQLEVKVAPGIVGAVSYTHLRAHETLR